MTSTKPSNPKDIVGSRKLLFSVLPWRVLYRVALAFTEGALKYGRHNYRAVGARASVYFDATQRHMGAWWEGEDVDADSKLSHIDKAIASLFVLRDSMLQGNWVDDRPPRSAENMLAHNERTAELIDEFGDRQVTHYTGANTNVPLIDYSHEIPPRER